MANHSMQDGESELSSHGFTTSSVRPYDFIHLSISWIGLTLLKTKKNWRDWLLLLLSLMAMIATGLIRHYIQNLSPIHCSIALTYVGHMELPKVNDIKIPFAKIPVWYMISMLIYISDTAFTMYRRMYFGDLIWGVLFGDLLYVICAFGLGYFFMFKLKGNQRRAALNLMIIWLTAIVWLIGAQFAKIDRTAVMWTYIGYTIGAHGRTALLPRRGLLTPGTQGTPDISRRSVESSRSPRNSNSLSFNLDRRTPGANTPTMSI